MSENQTIHSEYIYRGRVVTLRLDTLQTPDGKTIKREVVEHHGAVAIVPRLDAETVLLVRQYRQAAGEWLLEIPAGTLEDGEDAATCAARELEEEIGYTAAKLRPMFSQYLAPGYSNEVLHVFLAENLTESQVNPDEDEEIEIVPVKIAEIEAMVLAGKIKDAKSIAGLLAALRLF